MPLCILGATRAEPIRTRTVILDILDRAAPFALTEMRSALVKIDLLSVYGKRRLNILNCRLLYYCGCSRLFPSSPSRSRLSLLRAFEVAGITSSAKKASTSQTTLHALTEVKPDIFPKKDPSRGLPRVAKGMFEQ